MCAKASLTICCPAPIRVLLGLAAVLLAPGAFAAEIDGRHGAVEARVESLIVAVERLRAQSGEAGADRVAGLVDASVDVQAWLGDAVPELHRLSVEERTSLLSRTRALLIRRAVRHLNAGGEARITLDKTRVDGRGVAVDCLVHTPDAIYEITLRWSIGPDARLRDVQVEGVSVGAADRRRLRRAWQQGGLPAALAALDDAIAQRGVGDGLSGPPAVATRTTSDGHRAVVAEPPPSGRPPGL